LVYGYYVVPGFRSPRRTWCFWLALVFFAVATCSPLHYLGMHSYLSAHMISHILLLLICGPLFVMSLLKEETWLFSDSDGLSIRSVQHRAIEWLRAVSALLSARSWLAWMAGMGIMWAWHIPVLLNASLAAMGLWSPLAFLHQGSLLLAGMLFSWPLFGPFPAYRIHPMGGILYLGTACISCSLMGLLITFAPLGTYHQYQGMSMNGNPWQLTAKQDLQASGLIMWVPCCLIYLSGCMVLLARWLKGTRSGYRKPAVILKN
jgi:cytochrome c oxidase assembly factor CtaG